MSNFNVFNNLEKLDINEICRICMNNLLNNGIAIFNTKEEKSSLPNKIMTCASVQVVHGDGLPPFICQNCVQLLDNAFSLRKQCEEADKALRCYISKAIDDSSTIADVGNDCIDDTIYSEHSNSSEINPKEKITKSLAPFVNTIEKDLKCDSCGSSFKKLNQLKLHMRVHRKKTSGCKLCPESFSSSYELAQHNKSYHGSGVKKKTEETTHICSICEEKFLDNTSLIDHMLLNHTEKRVNISDKSKELVCNICNKKYLNQRNLVAHMGIHTGDKPLECSICKKRFTQV